MSTLLPHSVMSREKSMRFQNRNPFGTENIKEDFKKVVVFEWGLKRLVNVLK